MSSNLAIARSMVGQARELVASSRLVTIKLGDVVVQAQARQCEQGVELKFMADTPLGPLGGTIYAPQSSFENMMAAAEMSDVLPRAKALVEHVQSSPPRFLLGR